MQINQSFLLESTSKLLVQEREMDQEADEPNGWYTRVYVCENASASCECEYFLGDNCDSYWPCGKPIQDPLG